MTNPQRDENLNKLPQSFDETFDKYFSGNYNDNLGHNDCAIDGYCSLDPIIYSLMEVMLYELKQLTYYYIKMQELGYENKKLKNSIINYLSLIFIGYEFDRKEFENLLANLNKEKEAVKNTYTTLCDKKNLDCQILKSGISFDKFKLLNNFKIASSSGT